MDYYYNDELTCTIDSIDIDESTLRKLPPIQGYRHLPLVPLKEAVQPVISLVPDVQQIVDMVLENVEYLPKDRLTVDQSAAIMLYTLRWSPRENSFYYILNEALLLENRENLKPWFLYLRLIFSALSLLSRQTCTVYRGVKKNLQAYYPTEKKVVWWGFSSCTSKADLLQQEQFCGNSGSRTIFRIECCSGVNIKNHSLYKNENEILLLPGTQFKVISSIDFGYGLIQIHLREIPKDFFEEQSVGTLDVSKLPIIVGASREQATVAPQVPQRLASVQPLTNQSGEPFGVINIDSHQHSHLPDDDAQEDLNGVECNRKFLIALMIIGIIVVAFSLLSVIVGVKSRNCGDGRIVAWLIFTGVTFFLLIPSFCFCDYKMQQQLECLGVRICHGDRLMIVALLLSSIIGSILVFETKVLEHYDQDRSSNNCSVILYNTTYAVLIWDYLMTSITVIYVIVYRCFS